MITVIRRIRVLCKPKQHIVSRYGCKVFACPFLESLSSSFVFSFSFILHQQRERFAFVCMCLIFLQCLFWNIQIYFSFFCASAEGDVCISLVFLHCVFANISNICWLLLFAYQQRGMFAFVCFQIFFFICVNQERGCLQRCIGTLKHQVFFLLMDPGSADRHMYLYFGYFWPSHVFVFLATSHWKRIIVEVLTPSLILGDNKVGNWPPGITLFPHGATFFYSHRHPICPPVLHGQIMFSTLGALFILTRGSL